MGHTFRQLKVIIYNIITYCIWGVYICINKSVTEWNSKISWAIGCRIRIQIEIMNREFRQLILKKYRPINKTTHSNYMQLFCLEFRLPLIASVPLCIS